MLPEVFGGFIAAVQAATPRGLTLVETAIDDAIAQIGKQVEDLDLDNFNTVAFIRKSAFGAADRSPEVALHHTRAHAVMKATLEGVKTDLDKFKLACIAARDDIAGVDAAAATELKARLSAVTALSTALPGHGDDAYANAVQENGDTVATEQNPDAPVGEEGSL